MFLLRVIEEKLFIVNKLKLFISGGDFWKFESVFVVKSLSYGRIDKIIYNLRLIYKENFAYFNISDFAQKIY